MSDDKCNYLDFALGNSGIDATIPTRAFTIKVYCNICWLIGINRVSVATKRKLPSCDMFPR